MKKKGYLARAHAWHHARGDAEAAWVGNCIELGVVAGGVVMGYLEGFDDENTGGGHFVGAGKDLSVRLVVGLFLRLLGRWRREPKQWSYVLRLHRRARVGKQRKISWPFGKSLGLPKSRKLPLFPRLVGLFMSTPSSQKKKKKELCFSTELETINYILYSMVILFFFWFLLWGEGGGAVLAKYNMVYWINRKSVITHE